MGRGSGRMTVQASLRCLLVLSTIAVGAADVQDLSESSAAPDLTQACSQCHAKCSSVHCKSWCDQNWCGKAQVAPGANGKTTAPKQSADAQAADAIQSAQTLAQGAQDPAAQAAAKKQADDNKDKQEKQAADAKAAQQTQESVEKLAKEKQESAAKKADAEKQKGQADYQAVNEAADDARKEQMQKDKDTKVQNKKFNAMMEGVTEPPAIKDLLSEWHFVRKDGVQTAEPVKRADAKADPKANETNPPTGDANGTPQDTKAANTAACAACTNACKTDRCREWC